AEVERVIGDDVKIGRYAYVEYVEGKHVVVEGGAEVDILKYVEKADISEKAEVGKIEKIENLSKT
ncbi:MAG: hypothetical protein J7J99_05865, partial [Thermoprotei archaeon]|nr:hypothetical protein [Thermoprotei archaeon]